MSYTLRSIAIGLCMLVHVAGGGCAQPTRTEAPAAKPVAATVPRPVPLSGTKLVLLGTGTPNAEPDRCGPALAIVVNDTAYLVDCGPGVVRQAAAAAKRMGIKALEPPRLKHLFVTHLHSDHTLGLPDLMLTPWVLERNEKLQVYGPRGLQRMTDNILEAYEEDIRLRIGGSQPANSIGYRAAVHEIEAGRIYGDKNVTVTAFYVNHGSWKRAFGYRFDTADRSIVVSGDSAPPATHLLQKAKNCDVLVHEVYSTAGFARREPEWQTYHAESHTSSVELAEIANQVRPGLLVLTHQLYWGVTDEELLAEIRAHYDGPVVSGKDLDVY
jgi:ribonuclease BN (tRNA processing enzyme)